MVNLGKREKERETEPPKPKSHIPPLSLRWGNQQHLRCSNTTTGGGGGEFSGHRRPDGGIEAVREKLMMDLQAQTESMKAAMMREKGFDDEREGSPVKRQWNLRRRRERESGSGEKREFSLSASRGEIEEDFASMVGRRPPRRPKKRPRAEQKQLDDLFPGLWLPEITPDLYKVNGDAETGKK